MASTPDDFENLITAFNNVSSAPLRGVDAFCQLLEIQSQLRHAHHLDPAQDKAYQPLNTTRKKFNSLLCAKYFLAAQQLYEGATDQNFQTSGRRASEALSDLHLVPVYMELGKKALGDQSPLTAENWRKIKVSKAEYDELILTRKLDEAKRIWEIAKSRQNDYAGFTNLIHEIGTLVRHAGLDTADEKTYQRLGTTKVEFDALLDQRQQKEIARGPQFSKVKPALL